MIMKNDDFLKQLEEFINKVPEKYTALPFPKYPKSALSEALDKAITEKYANQIKKPKKL